MSALLGTASPGTVGAALALFALLVLGLGYALYTLELSQAARRRRRLRRALARAERARAATPMHQDLTGDELQRLAALRTRFTGAAEAADAPPADAAPGAGPSVGHSVGPSALAKLRWLWRHGYAGWVLAVLVGAFSMATHFGMFWLIVGGGWAGAVFFTLLGTALMVAACIWVGLGLVRFR